MCIILFSYRKTPGYRLILAANRDEFHARPTAPLSWWGKDGAILGGRDLQAGGTWLGVNRRGKFGALTNYREVRQTPVQAPSRGEILPGLLAGRGGCAEFLRDLDDGAGRYRGFNLLCGDDQALYYYSNRDGGCRRLLPGLYGLSNHLLDTPWPKIERGKMLFQGCLHAGVFTVEGLFAVLRDSCRPPQHRLPDTGVGREWEQLLAPIFIQSETYGTRSSAVLTIGEGGEIRFHERTFAHDTGEVLNEHVEHIG